MQSLLSFKGLASLLFAGLATAACTPSKPKSCNTATNRACWAEGFNITTDYEESTPKGDIVSYNWEITETDNWVGPDGVTKGFAQLINGQLPGPTLRAKWGDTISVTITNKLTVNG
jgi:FtsP/CotA-like multicopper oxidase with cupredoxin domain